MEMIDSKMNGTYGTLFCYNGSLNHKTQKNTDHMSHFIHEIMVFDCRTRT